MVVLVVVGFALFCFNKIHKGELCNMTKVHVKGMLKCPKVLEGPQVQCKLEVCFGCQHALAEVECHSLGKGGVLFLFFNTLGIPFAE